MINHARTLLMNVAGSTPILDYIAEEIVDPAFNQLSLPSELLQLRRGLFGSDPDRHMLNYRVRQLLAVVHASPLVEYILGLDKRITYDFESTQLIDPKTWIPQVVRINDSPELPVLGTPFSPGAIGRIQHKFFVSVDTPGTVSVERITAPIQKVLFEFSSGDTVQLVGSGCDVRLQSTNSGQRWIVNIYAQPVSDIGDLYAAVARLGEPIYNYLFGLSRLEPYETFRQIWYRNTELPMRMAAMVCAMVLRTERVRLNG